MQRETGIVKAFSGRSGLVTDAFGNDVFLPAQHIVERHSPRVGDAVTFRRVYEYGRPTAVAASIPRLRKFAEDREKCRQRQTAQQERAAEERLFKQIDRLFRLVVKHGQYESDWQQREAELAYRQQHQHTRLNALHRVAS
jgi:hypothetical protein